MSISPSTFVITGLDPVIQTCAVRTRATVVLDGRVKPGHDKMGRPEAGHGCPEREITR